MALRNLELQFGNLELNKTRNQIKTKEYYRLSGELCNWMINLWFMAKIESCELFADDILSQIELIKENWDEKKYLNVDLVIDCLVRNDSNLFDFDTYNRSSNCDKQLIYDSILQQKKKKKN